MTCFDIFQIPLPVKNARIVRPLGSDHMFQKKQYAPRTNAKGISRRDIQNAERRQRIYDCMLAFHKQRNARQTAGAIADASGVKLTYCQADLIELRDKYRFVSSSERKRHGAFMSQRHWWVSQAIERIVSPVGL